jgi:hypothetical protein
MRPEVIFRWIRSRHSTTIDATAIQVLSACLDAEALKTWWKARNAVVQPRPGGLLVLEWEPGSLGQDEVLGPLGGTLAGMLDKSMSGHFVHFGALHWMTPRGEVFGPDAARDRCLLEG